MQQGVPFSTNRSNFGRSFTTPHAPYPPSFYLGPFILIVSGLRRRVVLACFVGEVIEKQMGFVEGEHPHPYVRPRVRRVECYTLHPEKLPQLLPASLPPSNLHAPPPHAQPPRTRTSWNDGGIRPQGAPQIICRQGWAALGTRFRSGRGGERSYRKLDCC